MDRESEIARLGMAERQKFTVALYRARLGMFPIAWRLE